MAINTPKPTFTANSLLNTITPTTQLGELRKLAKEIKVNHPLALELWESQRYLPRQLAILIMDKKQLNSECIDELYTDMDHHPPTERLHLCDWLLANQLSKSSQLVRMVETWEKVGHSLQRRTFWYHQARLRWMGKIGHKNTETLLEKIERNLMHEEEEVQWAMNFTAGQIGKFQQCYRQRCIEIGERTGLYKDQVVAKGCTPSYLPKFIELETA